MNKILITNNSRPVKFGRSFKITFLLTFAGLFLFLSFYVLAQVVKDEVLHFKIQGLLKDLQSQDPRKADQAYSALMDLGQDAVPHLLDQASLPLLYEAPYQGTMHYIYFSIPPGYNKPKTKVTTGDFLLLICERILLKRNTDFFYPLLLSKKWPLTEIRLKTIEAYHDLYQQQQKKPAQKTPFYPSPLNRYGISWAQDPFAPIPVYKKASPSVLKQNQPDGMPTYKEFERKIRSYPYRASAKRTQQITTAVFNLEPCMEKKQIQNIMGNPDYSQSIYGPKGPAEKWQGWTWVYYIFMKSNLANENDPKVEIFFDRQGRATWIAPTKIKGAQDKKAPGGICHSS